MRRMKTLLTQAVQQAMALLPQIPAMDGSLEKLAHAMFECWQRRGKVLTAGNGGSAADAMHFAEELTVRFHKNRRALAAVALTDPTALTCAGNDFGYESIFARQIEALGNAGDVLVVFTTSGNSGNILRAVQQAKSQQLLTAAFLGKGGGQAKGLCDIEFVVPSNTTHRIQEVHQLLYHTLCEWIDLHVD